MNRKMLMVIYYKHTSKFWTTYFVLVLCAPVTADVGNNGSRIRVRLQNTSSLSGICHCNAIFATGLHNVPTSILKAICFQYADKSIVLFLFLRLVATVRIEFGVNSGHF
jgi:hypothetical protein